MSIQDLYWIYMGFKTYHLDQNQLNTHSPDYLIIYLRSFKFTKSILPWMTIDHGHFSIALTI